MTIDEIQERIIEEFSTLEDRFATYEYLINLGHALVPQDGDLRTDLNAISGCQGKVWMDSELRNGHLHFRADSEAMITKGIISLLLRVLNDQSPEDIIGTELFFLDKIGLRSNLSPSRANGLQAMVKKMRSDAAARMP
jgi:cysteine desulfuration protein SufE